MNKATTYSTSQKAKSDTVSLLKCPLAQTKNDTVSLLKQPLAQVKNDTVSLLKCPLAQTKNDTVSLLKRPLAQTKNDTVSLLKIRISSLRRVSVIPKKGVRSASSSRPPFVVTPVSTATPDGSFSKEVRCA